MYYAKGVNDVASLSNYSLVNLGTDNIVGGVDDTSVVINSATYNTTDRTITLDLNNNAVIPNATYRFIISGSGNVMDLAG
jgi:hypothetical protein